MQDIEEEVRLVREFKEDEEVEDQVGAGFRIWVAPKPGIPSFFVHTKTKQWWL